ncbi:hypothetical protein AAG906_026441 [Vitis piasezkii]
MALRLSLGDGSIHFVGGGFQGSVFPSGLSLRAGLQRHRWRREVTRGFQGDVDARIFQEERESRCIWMVHFRHLDMHSLSHSDSSFLRSTKLFTASQLLSELLLHYTCLLLAQGCVFGVDKSLTLTASLGGYVERG